MKTEGFKTLDLGWLPAESTLNVIMTKPVCIKPGIIALKLDFRKRERVRRGRGGSM